MNGGRDLADYSDEELSEDERRRVRQMLETFERRYWLRQLFWGAMKTLLIVVGGAATAVAGILEVLKYWSGPK
jgi:hypothetical protein